MDEQNKPPANKDGAPVGEVNPVYCSNISCFNISPCPEHGEKTDDNASSNTVPVQESVTGIKAAANNASSASEATLTTDNSDASALNKPGDGSGGNIVPAVVGNESGKGSERTFLPLDTPGADAATVPLDQQSSAEKEREKQQRDKEEAGKKEAEQQRLEQERATNEENLQGLQDFAKEQQQKEKLLIDAAKARREDQAAQQQPLAEQQRLDKEAAERAQSEQEAEKEQQRQLQEQQQEQEREKARLQEQQQEQEQFDAELEGQIKAAKEAHKLADDEFVDAKAALESKQRAINQVHTDAIADIDRKLRAELKAIDDAHAATLAQLNANIAIAQKNLDAAKSPWANTAMYSGFAGLFLSLVALFFLLKSGAKRQPRIDAAIEENDVIENESIDSAINAENDDVDDEE